MRIVRTDKLAVPNTPALVIKSSEIVQTTYNHITYEKVRTIHLKYIRRSTLSRMG